MDLKMEVYSPSLELLGLLEIQNSVIWERKAFSAGSFSLQSLITDESRTLLVPENIIWIAGEDAGIIEYVQQQSGDDGPYIEVKGYDLTGILERRILWGKYDLSGQVPDIMYRLVDDCCVHPTRGDTAARVIPGLALSDAPVGGASVRAQKTGGSLLEALEALGETYQVAFGIRFNPSVPQMEFWARPGVNRTINQDTNEPVFYSTELDDVLSSDYSYNSQDYRNIALVAGEGEGNNRTMVTVTNDGEAQTYEAVGFVVLGDSSAMRTADSRAFATAAITASGETYQSVYTGPQINEAVRKVLAG
ncbi:MAG: siphovirus ReqiPepy6 Gp37-like family protein, partial [Ruminococcus flavefaciens]|nr:siphovirus ReqiPepy6 Gp37-like family protein [Ruminococcus flavefaciens]